MGLYLVYVPKMIFRSHRSVIKQPVDTEKVGFKMLFSEYDILLQNFMSWVFLLLCCIGLYFQG